VAILGVSSAAGMLAATGTGQTAGEVAKARHGVRLHKVAHFNQPTFLTAPRSAKKLAFVTERAGQVRILNGDKKVRRSSTCVASSTAA
jgi:hypothetical protein